MHSGIIALKLFYGTLSLTNELQRMTTLAKHKANVNTGLI